jgi:hypothetical protein
MSKHEKYVAQKFSDYQGGFTRALEETRTEVHKEVSTKVREVETYIALVHQNVVQDFDNWRGVHAQYLKASH